MGEIGLIKYGKICFLLQKIIAANQPSKTANDNDYDHTNNILYKSHLLSDCLFGNTYFHAVELKIVLTGWTLYASYQNGKNRPRVGSNR